MTPDVTVLRGEPDEHELAALVAGLAAGGAPEPVAGDASEGAAVRARRRWRERAGTVRAGPAPGADTWRWSLHP